MVNILLITRSEIACIIILSYILFNGKLYYLGKDESFFSKLCFLALGHVVFDLITVYTVNHTESVPHFLNWACHVIFYLFAIVFSYHLLLYVIQIVDKKNIRILSRIGLFSIVAYTLCLPFLTIEYIQGNGTKYSMGTAAYAGYSIAFLMFFISLILLFIYRKTIKKHIFYAFFPALLLLIIFETLQILIPELLFTGTVLTIATLGLFFSLENPSLLLQRKIFQDTATHFLNRNCYERDIVDFEKKYQYISDKKDAFSFIFCDINNLKQINDNFGHLTGDECINEVASALLKCLKSTDKLYRFGGDEFLAMYQNTPEKTLCKEIEAVYKECERLNETKDYTISVALGYAISDNHFESLKDVIHSADMDMYNNKKQIKNNMQ